MSLKNLKSKEKVYENSLNPYLDGSTVTGNTFTAPSMNIEDICFDDMIEKPAWLDQDFVDGDKTYRYSDVLSIGAYYMNGMPLTSWSGQYGGTNHIAHKRQIMQNHYYLDALAKKLFPNGVSAYLKDNEKLELKISNLKILKMVPCSIGIGFNIHITFNLDDTENIWGKFENVGVDVKPKFICEEISNLNIENKIRVTGKIWNTILKWFKPQTGIYTMVAKQIYVYTELGQLKQLKEFDVIDVLHSDENRIKIIHDGTVYLIKHPIYYWFNWYFLKTT